MNGPAFTTEEVMTVAAARMLKNGAVCFVGIGLPSTAANLARLTHAPDLVLIYESGPIGAKPHVLPLSIGDGILAETADTVVSTPEIFQYWLQGGRIGIGFLGAAQIDRYANINTTVIGDYRQPKTRLPGAGGAPEIAACAGEIFIILRHARRAFVEKLDFITSVGHLDGGDARRRLGLPGKGPTAVITDLCILEPDPETKELVVTHLHPGIKREQVQEATGWPIRFAADVRETAAPTAHELEVLRDLHRRTAEAHGRA
ncbi:MAG TPA: CoA-transferase subunit beta [Burkholderiales bacterium]